MDNSYDDRYGSFDEINHDDEGSATYIDNDEFDPLEKSATPMPYYLNSIHGGDSDFTTLLNVDDDFPNPKDALGHAVFHTDATTNNLNPFYDIEGNALHDPFALNLLNTNNKNAMEVCLLHGGLEFNSKQELEDVMENLVDAKLIAHSNNNSYRCIMDDTNPNTNAEENEDIIIHQNTVLFPAMYCSEDLLDKVIELANTCTMSYIKFVHIAEDTTIISEITDGKETLFYDNLETIAEFLLINDDELKNITELKNDDELSTKIYDYLVAWLNTDNNEED